MHKESIHKWPIPSFLIISTASWNVLQSSGSGIDLRNASIRILSWISQKLWLHIPTHASGLLSFPLYVLFPGDNTNRDGNIHPQLVHRGIGRDLSGREVNCSDPSQSQNTYPGDNSQEAPEPLTTASIVFD
jgi:hypothetical protein